MKDAPGPMRQQELESYLWGAAKLLRGLIDAGDYRQFVFPLLFFKRLSDVWDEEYQFAFDETGNEAYARATANDRFAVPDGAHWSDVRGSSRDVGRALLNAFRAIEAANPDRLSGAFGPQRGHPAQERRHGLRAEPESPSRVLPELAFELYGILFR